MICTRKGCSEEAGKHKTCPAHRAKQRAANDKFFGRKHPTDHECETVGCGAIVGPRARFCAACIKERENAQKREYNRTTRAATKGVKVAKQPKPVNLKTEDERLSEAYQGLNHEMLMQRMMRGAIPAVLNNFQ
jgi:hypothetical protein